MVIAFWSNVHGQAATTSNLLATAIYDCLKYKRKIAILQSHFSLNNLDVPLVGTLKKEEFLISTGMDALLRDAKSGELSEEIIINDGIALLNEKCNLYIGTSKNNKELFESDMRTYIGSILHKVDEVHDFTFVDVASGYNPVSERILENSDLIVINLNQNREVIKNFFQNWKRDYSNVYFLIGRYDKDSNYNLKNLCNLYPTLKKKVAALEYNIAFSDAFSDGKLVNFFLKNIDVSWNHPNFSFIESLDSIVKSIEKKEKREDNC